MIKTNDRLSSIISIIILLLIIVAGAAHGGNAGRTSAHILQIGSGARLPAMGGAGQASLHGPAALHYNPAGLAYGNDKSIEFTYLSLVENINYGNFDFATPVNDKLGAAMGLTYLDYGSEDRVEWSDNDLVASGSFDGSDIVLSGGLAYSMNNWSFGAATRILRLKIDDEKAAGAVFDLGTQWHSSSPDYPFSAGFVIKNIGDGVRYDMEQNDMPVLIRAGGTYHFSDYGLKISADMEHLFRESSTNLMFGGEWSVYDAIALRLGYDDRLDVDNGLTYGLGIAFPDSSMSLDYALVPYGDFGTVHRVAFKYRMKAPTPESQPEPAIEIKRDTTPEVEIDTQPEPAPDPFDWDAAYTNGRRAFDGGNYQLAREHFLKCYEHRPGHVTNLNWLGATEYRLGLYDEARSRFERVLTLEPENEYARNGLSLLELRE